MDKSLGVLMDIPIISDFRRPYIDVDMGVL